MRAQQPAFIVAPGLHLHVKAVQMSLLTTGLAAAALVDTLQSEDSHGAGHSLVLGTGSPVYLAHKS